MIVAAGQLLDVTRHGKPVAQVGPPPSDDATINLSRGSILRQEDLLSPVVGIWDSVS
ncbi:MAG TPA: hypothetical protein VGG49_08985 [Steroidobacteraceae bacterium]